MQRCGGRGQVWQVKLSTECEVSTHPTQINIRKKCKQAFSFKKQSCVVLLEIGLTLMMKPVHFVCHYLVTLF